MLRVEKEFHGRSLEVKLIGAIEQRVNFTQLVGPLPNELILNCKEVLRINPAGVKAWSQFFQSCRLKGIQMKFTECSVAIVEQINLIPHFVCGGVVESIMVPYLCSQCESEISGLFQTEELVKMDFSLPELECSNCGAEAVFDDCPREFLQFLRKPKLN